MCIEVGCFCSTLERVVSFRHLSHQGNEPPEECSNGREEHFKRLSSEEKFKRLVARSIEPEFDEGDVVCFLVSSNGLSQSRVCRRPMCGTVIRE